MLYQDVMLSSDLNSSTCVEGAVYEKLNIQFDGVEKVRERCIEKPSVSNSLK